ncbi:GH36-type glycosyl hydrolase domain-containing protein [Pandoraea sputorum]|uniref:Cellobiose phosphorylase n=1 Tax=Pandoraea sputorum TaxID=93222 RepID=A0A5E5BD68_9BURK|nr:glucoamylase family protein [Pandoraea sputorum]VVE82563.1 Cellobiose phosphorylase [Pandoraea sputorum]
MWKLPEMDAFVSASRGTSDFGPPEAPIRAELFSRDRLEQHALSLAHAQQIAVHPPRTRSLTSRAADNERVLRKCYDATAQATLQRRSITPAAEWLLDNFRTVSDQFREVRHGLNTQSFRSLPRLLDSPLRGYPRIYGVLWAFVAHTDSRFDPSLLSCFLLAYQKVEPLTMAELWAMPLTLRAVMIENLRRLCAHVTQAQVSRQAADRYADDLLSRNTSASPTHSDAPKARARVVAPFEPAFTVQLIQRLRYQDRSLQWLSDQLAQQGQSADDVVQAEHASQAAANMTVRNVITSLRDMRAFAWQPLFEEVSLVDAHLRHNPGYADMDFATRDAYRHEIEKLAARSRLSELAVTQALNLKTAAAAAGMGDSVGVEDVPRRMDPGYYLLSAGRRGFEREIAYRAPLTRRWQLHGATHCAVAYIVGVCLFSCLTVAVPLSLSAAAGVSVAGLVLLAICGLFPASELAVLLIDSSLTRWIPPRHLPRLELADGISPDLRTFVVVPMMLTNEADIAAQTSQLEVHYLANPKGDVRFALLSDWRDADTEHIDSDMPLLDAASARIAVLNARYATGFPDTPRFFLFHRRRLWNDTQGKWLAWERKRGKLHEFNRLLRGATDTSFMNIDGRAPSVPPGVRYVITLDSDTRLPIDAVQQLVGTAAHPLNRPYLDPTSRRVVAGYGILQPRITPTLPSMSEGTVYSRLFSGTFGIDPYAGAVSDVYQDLLGEGSYIGKGLYDVDAFESSLAGRIPENTILSHDLFEGNFARCGLVTDIELFEDFPSHAQVAATRLHRWIRGDWQLLPWIIGKRGGAIPAAARWKMLDNLRRSLTAPGALATLVCSWVIARAPVEVWSALVLLAISAPAIFMIAAGLIPSQTGISMPSHWRAVGRDVRRGVERTFVVASMMANHAWLAADAVARTLFRLTVSRRRLLEWVTAAQVKLHAGRSLGNFLWSLRGAVTLTALCTAIVEWLRPASLPWAAPFLIAWGLSPFVAQWVSRQPSPARPSLVPIGDNLALRVAGRRIWRFFATFVDEENHHLPPDNFQEDPRPVVAHRSSPTNFGLYLLSVLSARDFGWIGVTETVERLERTLGTMSMLARHQGHFFNWYDTRDLTPLIPQYVSSVDSGNLAGHLLVVASACEEIPVQPLFARSQLDGVLDTLALLRDAIAHESDDRRTLTVNRDHLYQALNALERVLLKPAPSVPIDAFADASESWRQRWYAIDRLVSTLVDLAQTFVNERGDAAHSEVLYWVGAIRDGVKSHLRDLAPNVSASGESPQDNTPSPSPGMEVPAAAIAKRFEAVAVLARSLFDEMDFRFLFAPERRLFSIGYRMGDSELDNSYYDLLASEARLTSFIAIAKGDVPATHWFRLGRIMMPYGKAAVLMSWSGSMFEYLMPSLVMDYPHQSLLDSTCALAVSSQIAYGKERNVPWGISESACNIRDRALTYQYADFGVPELALKRGLARSLVVAPYATVLAAMYDVPHAIANLKRLDAVGARGIFGYYDAVDYTPSRLPKNCSAVPVRTYMAHHQGMSLVALSNVFFGDVMRQRFHRQAVVRAAELLLHEANPREICAVDLAPDIADTPLGVDAILPVMRRFYSAGQTPPATHILSNGEYSVMVSAAGSGYSLCGKAAVTRWREDLTCDPWGSYLFLRDMANDAVWSAAFQPVGTEPDNYDVAFSEDRASIVRHEGSLVTTLEILVSPEDNAEVRRLSITNAGQQTREIEVTSYAEIVLAPMGSDTAHPAFSNLFVQTEYLPEVQGLLAMRRPRGGSDKPLWAAHVLASTTHGGNVGYETDRARFITRGRTIRDPVAVMDGRPLSNTVGPVLDPIFSLRTRVIVAPGATEHLVFSTMVAPNRESLLDLTDKYRDPACFQRISTLAWTRGQVNLHYLGITADDAQLFQFIANRVLYVDPAMRAAVEVLKRNVLSATSLWRFGISGDLPIVLVRVDDPDDRDIVRQLLRAHEYWQDKGVPVDLVILNERKVSYVQDLQVSLQTMVSGTQVTPAHGAGHGGISVIRADGLDASEMTLLLSAARVVLAGAKQGSLEEQVVRMGRSDIRKPTSITRIYDTRGDEYPDTPLPTPTLEYFNGLGGFADQGREYVTVLGPGQRTPAPWVNIIANPGFGFQVSESGGGYTWASNSQENQLTPWSNDPVVDPCGEAFFLRDDDTGHLWSPTASPIRLENTRYVAAHGFGYSRFEHAVHGLKTELVQFVSWHDPVKLSTLTVENRTKRPRKLSVAAYVEWVLGNERARNAPFVVSEIDPLTGAMFATNPWNAEFGERVTFIDWCGDQTGWTGDRTEFIGRNGDLAHPAGMMPDAMLSDTTGAGMDPCGALLTQITLGAGERIELAFILGQANDRDAARQYIQRYRVTLPSKVLSTVKSEWHAVLTQLQVETPDRATDLMLNGWLLYQVVSCRMWARSAFYQASGAFGFRDQLQDCMALCHSRPDLAREHILKAAARQFVEGDVQHWWHPPSGRGVRTHISDDRLWLPYTVAHYIRVTGDTQILDEHVPYLEGRTVADNEENAYYVPTVSVQTGPLFEHCQRAIDCSLATGVHGLPLMGGGDWNDGLNRVGVEGKGESIWLGWFLHATAMPFADLADARAEVEAATRWRAHAERLRAALNNGAWDGAWYLRAYYDDGTSLGGAGNAECRIDSIAQSWSVISGAGDPERQRRAMESVEHYLVRPGDDLILLLAPPFDKMERDPGYIKGYLPGVRENGGQYTHAATWCMIAFAQMGDGNRAGDMLKMLNPINHADTRAGVHAYKVEPYVMAGDIYTAPPHVRRGGWTWYTGAAGWLYRGAIESVLGLQKRGNALRLAPCIPGEWCGFRLNYLYGASLYIISVANAQGQGEGCVSVSVDGHILEGNDPDIPLVDDGHTHHVQVSLVPSSEHVPYRLA